MTAKCMMAATFLSGKIISNKNCYFELGLTNCSREVIRMIESSQTGFGVTISRVRVDTKSRWGKSIYYYKYRLNKSMEQNKDGIKKMCEYVKKNIPQTPKTDKELGIANDLNKILSAYQNF